MSDTDTQTNPYKPLTHAQRGCLGGLAKVPKGFASADVMAKALETRAKNRATVKWMTIPDLPKPSHTMKELINAVACRPGNTDLTQQQQPTKEQDHGSDQ